MQGPLCRASLRAVAEHHSPFGITSEQIRLWLPLLAGLAGVAGDAQTLKVEAVGAATLEDGFAIGWSDVVDLARRYCKPEQRAVPAQRLTR